VLRHYNIRQRLTILLLVFALVPILIMAWVNHYNNYKVLKDRRSEQLQLSAELLLDRFNDLTFFALEAVQSWANTEVLKDLLVDDVDQRIHSDLQTYSTSYGIFSEIIVIDTEKNVIAATVMQKKGLRIDDSFDLQRIIDTKNGFIDTLRFDLLADGFAIPVVSPISGFEENKPPIGYIIAYLHWSELLDIIHNVRLGESSHTPENFAVLYDENGNVIAGPEFVLFSDDIGEKSDTAINANFISKGYQSAQLSLSGKNGSMQETIEDQEYLIGFASSKNTHRMSSLNWGVMVIQNLELTYRPLELLQQQIVLLIITLILLSIFFAYRVSNSFTSPLRELTHHAEAIAGGQLERTIMVSTEDEIGHLAHLSI